MVRYAAVFYLTDILHHSLQSPRNPVYISENTILQIVKQKQDLRNCHNTWVVRDTENIVTTFDISQSVTCPYKKNVSVA